ncbi:MAG: hypothetical protein ABL958_04085 [Bdellovibrionia bacterium]
MKSLGDSASENKRIARFVFAKHRNSALGGAIFFSAALFTLYQAGRTAIDAFLYGDKGNMTPFEMAVFIGFLVLFSMGFGFFGGLFWFVIYSDPCAHWFFRRKGFVLVRGVIADSHYIPHSEGKRSLEKYRLSIQYEAEGQKHSFREDVPPWICPKGRVRAMKGLEVLVLCEERNRNRAGLAGFLADLADS